MTQSAVLVTGTSTGIGRATALLLDARGWTVFAGVRRPEDARSLAEAASDRLVPLTLDVTEAGQVEAAAELIAGRGIPLAGLVNNAGIAAAAPLEFVPLDALRRQLEVNVVGQVAVTQAMLPMLGAAKGRIVNVTSVGGLVAGPMLGPYHASKFALEAITDTLRNELAPWGIEVIAIEPGAIATPIWATSAAAADRMQLPAEAAERYRRPMAAARASAAKASKHGLPPERVAEVIERALTTRRPRTRYPVGTDAKAVAWLLAGLPDRMRDRVVFGLRRR
jgi:NAD(P)-dependent dehydrogenase (short-subunit alcohol dehydrogenase family)